MSNSARQVCFWWFISGAQISHAWSAPGSISSSKPRAIAVHSVAQRGGCRCRQMFPHQGTILFICSFNFWLNTQIYPNMGLGLRPNFYKMMLHEHVTPLKFNVTETLKESSFSTFHFSRGELLNFGSGPKVFRYLRKRYPEHFGRLFEAVGKLLYPYKPYLHTAYIGGDSSILGTWNVWWMMFMNMDLYITSKKK